MIALASILSSTTIPPYANAAVLNPTAIDDKVEVDTNTISNNNLDISHYSKFNITKTKI